MSDTTYINNSPPTVDATWLNDVNVVTYRVLGVGGVAPTTAGQVLANIGAAPVTGNPAVTFNVAPATASTHAVPLGQITSLGVPTGTILPFAGTAPPVGYLLLPIIATTASRATYAALFAVLGTTWGAGDGSTTFGLPYVGADGTLLASNGNLGTTTVGQVLGHTHIVGGAYGGTPGSGGIVQSLSGGAVYTQGQEPAGGSQNTAAGSRVNFIIKT